MDPSDLSPPLHIRRMPAPNQVRPVHRWMEALYPRQASAPSDSAHSKQLTTLEEAGYVELRKSFVGNDHTPHHGRRVAFDQRL